MTITSPTVPTYGAVRRWRHSVAGARDITPMVIGVLPLGLAIGVAISTSSIPALAGWAAGPLIFGGAAQLMAVQLLDAGAAPAVIIVSALLVNSRIVMYSAAIAPWFRTATLRQRLLVLGLSRAVQESCGEGGGPRCVRLTGRRAGAATGCGGRYR